jgi:hypothetical protein
MLSSSSLSSSHTVNGMSNPTIAELTNACVITGVPTKIGANPEYGADLSPHRIAGGFRT